MAECLWRFTEQLQERISGFADDEGRRWGVMLQHMLDKLLNALDVEHNGT